MLCHGNLSERLQAKFHGKLSNCFHFLARKLSRNNIFIIGYAFCDKGLDGFYVSCFVRRLSLKANVKVVTRYVGSIGWD